ncbi:MAG TPA: DNA polymerase/3'-5' exonuclease PolX [Gemmatimonadaceae bacterium]|nr:DNA polymerase/3'-5' exonuclease PolX [Gemmatimonadaceae bacterium]HTK52574.1 DNA polymerase/3'-5' exonuclease PolX [Gemmatimonadaceae bacterium]
MDSRTAAHVLSQIAAHLELKGENAFKCRAYDGAARALRALGAEDLEPLYRSGELAGVRGLGPATLAVLRDLIETGESRYLEQLRESTPEGLLDMLAVPGMTPARIQRVFEELNIGTVEELEAAARDGRLATLPKIGPKTAAKIVAGIAAARERGALGLYHHAAVEAGHLLSAVRSHPDVDRAELAGALRRRTEVVGTVDIVAACRSDPVATAQSFTRMAGVRRAQGTGASVSISYVDGARLSLRCVLSSAFAVALWEETGNAEHVAAVRELLHGRGFSIRDGLLIDPSGSIVPVRDEADLYRAAGLALVPPELREARGEVAAARDGSLPALVEVDDIRGVLHCHSSYSDGKATVAEMARGARARGWRYLGISDHSQAAFYAGGLPRDRVLAQHDEIDELNATLDGFRVLKGIEADILPDGRLDYGDELLDRFEFVIGSIHSRFAMDRIAMTERVVRALDDPRMTILAHPTGRLLLSREPYAIDLAAVLQKAADVGVAVELNADPHRLDLDWRHLQTAKRLGVRVEIGPDAHSVTGLDNMEIGVAIARKGWLEPGDVLNAASADDVLAFARARRTTG